MRTLPFVSWSMATFHHAPPWFYFGRLVEFSLLYLFAYYALLTWKRIGVETGHVIVVISTVGILGFFSVWGNYQSRYILAVLPFLIVLGTRQLEICFAYAIKGLPRFSNKLMLSALLVLVYFILMRTFALNIELIYKNDFCFY